MNNAARSIFGFVIFCIASLCAVAQQTDPVFLKIELAIRQDEPHWTLMNRWFGPQSAGLRWKLDQHEIFAWIIIEPSVDEAIKFFEDDGLGALPNKTPRQTLNIGDGAYLRQAGPHALKPDYAEAHYNLGLLYVATGERSQAQAEYEILKRLGSDLADALLRRIR